MEPLQQRTTYQHYEVERRADGSLHELGRGAMGITYKALDTNLHVPVALKVITGVLLPDARARSRFLREARAAAQLRHSNVATVYHLGQEEDFCFYTMEFIEGETIEAHVRRDGPMPTALALRVGQQTARALQAAHSRGLLHRDLKPSNLMLAAEGEELLVKVIDFGLVKPLQQDGADASVSLSGGMFLGTPLYASPEQCASDEAIDGRADLYSLGATLWFMLTAEPIFKGTMRTVITQHLTKLPPFETLTHLPESVVALLRDLLAKEPADRLPSAAALRTRLNEILPTIEAQTSVSPPVRKAIEQVHVAPLTLDRVLRRRGNLNASEVDFLIPKLPALLTAGSIRTPEIAPRNAQVRLQDARIDAEALLTLPLPEWPPFSLEYLGQTPSSDTAESLEGTLLEEVRRLPANALEGLALLIYELLSGSPLPLSRGYRPLSALGEAGNDVLRRALTRGTTAPYNSPAEFLTECSRHLKTDGTEAALAAPSSSQDRRRVVVPEPAETVHGSFPTTAAPVVAPELYTRRHRAGGVGMGKGTRVFLASAAGLGAAAGLYLLLRPAVVLTSDNPTPAGVVSTPTKKKSVTSLRVTTPRPLSTPAALGTPAPSLAVASPTPELVVDDPVLQPASPRPLVSDWEASARGKLAADPSQMDSPSPIGSSSPSPASPAVTPTATVDEPSPAPKSVLARRWPFHTSKPSPAPSPPSSRRSAGNDELRAKASGLHEVQRRAIELQHKNGVISDADYRQALKDLGN